MKSLRRLAMVGVFGAIMSAIGCRSSSIHDLVSGNMEAYEQVRKKLERDAKLVGELDENNVTPLFHASHWQMADLLYKYGADVNYDSGGSRPIHWAAEFNRVNVLNYLLSKGALIEDRAYLTEITPLMIASMNGNVESVYFLLENGADPAAVSSEQMTATDLAKRGMQALHLPASAYYVEKMIRFRIVLLLLSGPSIK